MSFHRVTTPIARREHACAQCRKRIEIGTRHRYCALHHDGEFSTYREHFECHDAWSRLNFTLRECDPYDGAAFLADDDEHEPGDREWMRDEFPIVADRLGWLAARDQTP